MAQGEGLKQPALGILSTVICVIGALSIILWFEPQTFAGWVTFLIICCIPAQVVLSLVWQGGYPAPAASLAQPFKGVYLTLLAGAAGAIVAAWVLNLVPGFQVPGPGPVQLHFIIMTVATTLWLVIVWQCWPTSAVKPHPAFIGISTWVLSYILTWILFQIFWDFGLMAKAPFYSAAADPGGLFSFDQAMAFYIATVGVILAMVLLDMWPISKIPAKFPSLGKPPAWGIMMTVWVLVVTWGIYTLFVTSGGMDPTVFLVKVAVSWIFGEFIMLNLMQTWPVQAVRQPVKGIVLIACTAILAVVTYFIYGLFCKWIAGPLPSGAPTYAFELWIASAMLGVTFPVIVLFTGFLEYWPLTEPLPAVQAEESPANEGHKVPVTLEESIDEYM